MKGLSPGEGVNPKGLQDCLYSIYSFRAGAMGVAGVWSPSRGDGMAGVWSSPNRKLPACNEIESTVEKR